MTLKVLIQEYQFIFPLSCCFQQHIEYKKQQQKYLFNDHPTPLKTHNTIALVIIFLGLRTVFGL